MLTQAEIDALLSGAIEVEQSDSRGGVNLAEIMGGHPGSQGVSAETVKQVRPYNFWSPDRFSKDQMRAVELVHEDLAERLSSTLPPYLHSEMRLRVVHIEQGRFDDFMRDLSPSSLYHLVNLDPLPGRIVITVSSEISWVVLGRMLGGNTTDEVTGSGPITEIGQSLMNVVVGYMLNDIKASWGKVVTLEPHVEDSTTNHHWVQMIMGNARVMLVTFELAIGAVTGTMSIYLPFAMLKPIADVLNPHAWIVGREENTVNNESREYAMEGLSRIKLPFRVILGTADLTIGELANLGTGDVIRLDRRIDQDLEVNISGRTRFRARAGKQGRRMAVQIVSVEPVDLVAEEE
ncbi:MAG: FliM/FliN family flagellar motor switch protein [Anaerolineales bacterium]|nr:FliM/FliN family flagellar motor switch protein [Anaerolineales bacterium]